MFANPRETAAKLKLKSGMMVADFGAGEGSLTLELAAGVGSKGRVYAVDVNKELLARLQSQARARGINNVEPIWANVEKRGGVALADNTVDLVVISNILFQSSARLSVALEAKRILKPGGTAAVIDWSSSAGGAFGGLGPRSDAVVTAEAAHQIFIEAGLLPIERFSAGDHHWGIIFKKP